MAKAIKALGLGTTTQNWGQGGEGKISGKITKVEANEKYIDVHYTISNFASYQQPIVIISHNTPSFLKNNALENNVNIWRFYNDPDDGYPLTFTVSLYYKNNIGNDKNLHLLDSKEYDIYTLLNKNDEHKKTVTNSNVNVVTYHIYHDKRIELHKPSVLTDDKIKFANFIYHDKNGKENNIYYGQFLNITKKDIGKVNQNPNQGKSSTTIDYEGLKNQLSEHDRNAVNVEKSFIYDNGDVLSIGNFGGRAKIFYKSLSEKINLVYLKPVLYNKNGIYIAFKFTETLRYYCNPNVFAAFIGVLAEVGFELKSTGSCFSDGTSYPSIKHNNGFAIDIAYFKDISKDQKVINAFKNWKFNDRIIGNDTYHSKLNNQTASNNMHDDHLHSGNLKLEIKIVEI